MLFEDGKLRDTNKPIQAEMSSEVIDAIATALARKIGLQQQTGAASEEEAMASLQSIAKAMASKTANASGTFDQPKTVEDKGSLQNDATLAHLKNIGK